MIDKETGIEYGFIYKITNKINGKVYIGQTVEKLRRRWTTHLAVARKGNRRLLSLALIKYGEDAFTIEPLALVPGSWLNYVETACIEIYDSMWKGYNMRMDGSRISPDVRKRMSEAHKGKPSARKGKKNSPEQTEKNRQAKLGTKHSEETKAKMSAAHKAWYAVNPGRPVSDVQKAKISKTLTGKKQSAETIEKRMVQLRGRTFSPEARANMSAAQRGLKKPQKPEHIEMRRLLLLESWAKRKALKQGGPQFLKN